MPQLISGNIGHLCWLIGPKNTNLIEDVEYLLPVKFHQIQIACCRRGKCFRQSEARAAIGVERSVPKTQKGRGRWVRLASIRALSCLLLLRISCSIMHEVTDSLKLTWLHKSATIPHATRPFPITCIRAWISPYELLPPDPYLDARDIFYIHVFTFTMTIELDRDKDDFVPTAGVYFSVPAPSGDAAPGGGVWRQGVAGGLEHHPGGHAAGGGGGRRYHLPSTRQGGYRSTECSRFVHNSGQRE